jgi:hypothetical protein
VLAMPTAADLLLILDVQQIEQERRRHIEE